MRRLLALLLVLFVAAGCSRNKKPSDALDSDTESTLHVNNQHFGDVDIYVVHDGSRTRVGSVTATSEQTFTLNARVIGRVGTMQLIAHGVGTNGSVGSEQFSIRPGMQIDWTLDSRLSRATLAIY
ncbi:MAG: hypothetical protein ABI889_13960 [Gemmatimonadota bacterium]